MRRTLYKNILNATVQWLMGRLMLWMSGQLVFTGYKDAARNLPGPIDVSGIVDSVPDVLRVELRDALTAAIDAPRLAARATAEVVARDEVDGSVIVLLRTPFEWAARYVAGPDDAVTWYATERPARMEYAIERGKALCICGAECDADEIDRSGDDPQCPKCVAEAAAAFKALRFDCRRCGADLLGADLTTRADSDPDSPWQCPRCNHFAVEEIDAMTEATL